MSAAAGMTTWIYMLHPPRENFAATMTPQEQAVWQQHFTWLGSLFEKGTLVFAGVTGGTTNTGFALFEASDEAAAHRIVADDPVTHAGFAAPELRPFEMGLLRGSNPTAALAE